ncbi:MAG: hypothetical protein ACJA17_001162 [Polaribacter sp.]|jgi:hypothetical protein
MGSMAAELTRKSIDEFGEEFWKTHIDTVHKYWEVIRIYCDAIDFGGKPVKVYQDGMVADGDIALKIMEDSLKAGSENYEIISRLVNRGALIVKTEDLSMVKKELDMLKSTPISGSLIMKVIKIIRFKISRHKLLVQRDKFITKSINDTLGPNETGILFIGAYHNVLEKLPKDIAVTELKEINKVREYQKLIPFHTKRKDHFENLSKYLIQPEVYGR